MTMELAHCLLSKGPIWWCLFPVEDPEKRCSPFLCLCIYRQSLLQEKLWHWLYVGSNQCLAAYGVTHYSSLHGGEWRPDSNNQRSHCLLLLYWSGGLFIPYLYNVPSMSLPSKSSDTVRKPLGSTLHWSKLNSMLLCSHADACVCMHLIFSAHQKFWKPLHPEIKLLERVLQKPWRKNISVKILIEDYAWE